MAAAAHGLIILAGPAGVGKSTLCDRLVTEGAANPINMQALKALVSTSQIVFGTDMPFFDGTPIVQGLRSSGFTETEVQAIERDNALQLLPRLGRS